jgi:hypothetical protein
MPMASPPGSAAGFACKYENFEEWRTRQGFNFQDLTKL